MLFRFWTKEEEEEEEVRIKIGAKMGKSASIQTQRIEKSGKLKYRTSHWQTGQSVKKLKIISANI